MRVSSAETSPDGLARKSTAPAASASNVSRAPSVVCAESITTGVGRVFMSARTAPAPSSSGMLKSIVQTSGLQLLHLGHGVAAVLGLADDLEARIAADDLLDRRRA